MYIEIEREGNIEIDGKHYPFFITIAGQVEHGEVYDVVINNDKVRLSDFIDAEDFIDDLIREKSERDIDHAYDKAKERRNDE
jgi:hypothetical protein